MDALRIKEFFFESKNELPNSSISVKEVSFVYINLQSILLRVVRRLILLSSNKGQKSEKLILDHITTTKKIKAVLKIMIEFMFTQMAQSQTKSCHQSNSFVIVTVKKTSWSGSNKFEDIAFQNTKTFSVPNGRIQFVPFNDCIWEESVSEKVTFDFDQRNTISISRSIRFGFKVYARDKKN